MQEATLMEQGINLMLFGMGTVFTFLMVLIVTTLAMSAVVQFFDGGKSAVHPTQVNTPASQATQSNQSDLIAVITAAIAQHRSKKD